MDWSGGEGDLQAAVEEGGDGPVVGAVDGGLGTDQVIAQGYGHPVGGLQGGGQEGRGEERKELMEGAAYLDN